MNEAVKNNKKWSKKKKIVVITLSVLCTLIVLVVIAGVAVLNWYCKTGEYEIAETNQSVTLIAHRGMRSVAPENTTASFKAAGEAGYWGAECDIYRTADGVWIVSHDVNSYRMMDKTANIEKKTFDELMTHKVDNGVNIDRYPDLTYCTLEEYLQICKEYNMVAVIELKGKNNTEHYQEIIDLTKQYNVKTIYISFHEENLIELRKLTNAKLYFLTQKISDEDIEFAKSLDNCGIDFNGNKEANLESDMIEKCINAGIDLGAWTIDDIETLDLLFKKGVVIITTDCITASTSQTPHNPVKTAE